MKRLCKRIMAIVVAAAVVFGTVGLAPLNAFALKMIANPNGLSVEIHWDYLLNYMSEHEDMNWYAGMSLMGDQPLDNDFLTVSGLVQDDIWNNGWIGLVYDNEGEYYPFLTTDQWDKETELYLLYEFQINNSQHELFEFDVDLTNGGELANQDVTGNKKYDIYILIGTWNELISAPEPDPEPQPCQHDYVWFTEGEKEILRCKNCGLVAIDAMNHLNLKNTEKVEVEMVWNSLPARVVEEIADAEKETTFRYSYKGYDVTIKVPADKIIVVPGVKWYGPEFLADLYREYTSVKNWRGPVSIEVLFK